MSKEKFTLQQVDFERTSQELIPGHLECPKCKGKFKVTETRSSPEVVRRIRECKSCKVRFMTEERIIEERNYLK